MDEIKDIYNRELYRPFVEFCAAHGYRTMRDLGCYDFRLLSRREGFSPMLITRIKAVYAAYQKSEAEKSEAAAPRRRTAQPISLVMETQLLLQMFRAAGGQLKRTRIAKLLSDAPWCIQVERGTYYWNDNAPAPRKSVAELQVAAR